MLPHPLTNVEIQKYCKNEPKFNGGYSRNNLPRIKDGTYIISRVQVFQSDSNSNFKTVENSTK